MSDIDNTIDTLRDQVEALQADNEQLREANSEWSELANDYDVDTLRRFLDNNDIDAVERVLDNYDLDDLKDAYDKIENYGEPQELAERVEELEEAERKIEEYGDPEDMAAELQELKEAVESDTPEAPADNEELENAKSYITRLTGEFSAVSEEVTNLRADFAEAQNLFDIINAERNSYKLSWENNKIELQSKDDYIVNLKSEVARLDSELVRLSDELERTYGTVSYKALYDATLNELSAAKCNLASIKAAHENLRRNYFAEVSGYDDVPSSAPDLTEGDCTGPGFTE